MKNFSTELLSVFSVRSVVPVHTNMAGTEEGWKKFRQELTCIREVKNADS